MPDSGAFRRTLIVLRCPAVPSSPRPAIIIAKPAQFSLKAEPLSDYDVEAVLEEMMRKQVKGMPEGPAKEAAYAAINEKNKSSF